MQSIQKPQAVVRQCKVLLAGLLLPLAMTAGCATGSHTGDGLVGGAAIGGILGTVVGAATGRPLQGAAIGAGIGAGVGGLSGAAADHQEKKIAQASAQASAAAVEASQAELARVAEMAQKGFSDAVIIDHIRASGCTFSLSVDQLSWLRDNHVSDPVIRTLEQMTYQPAQVIYTRPVYRPAPVVIVEEPRPVGFVGVGVRIR